MPVEDHVLHLENGRLAADTPVAEVRRIVERAVQHDGDGGVVIHIHGGLVKHAKGIALAETLHSEYLEAGGYPIFLVWESGLVETIVNNAGQVLKERFFELLWKRLSNIVMRKFGQSDQQRAFGQLPPVDDAAVQNAIDGAVNRGERQPLEDTEPEIPHTLTEISDAETINIEDELMLDPELTVAIKKISNGLRTPDEIERDLRSRSATVRGSDATLMDPRAVDQLVDRPDPHARGVLSTAKMIKAIASISAKVVRRFVNDRHHGFHATLVEEILRELYVANVGGLIWEAMKRDTADAFGDDPGVHGGTAFIEALRAEVGGGAPPRITLIGHSTGAVFISEFLDTADAMLPDAWRFGVVFEAPASTCGKTAATLARHGDRIDGFRMFAMKDEREKGDRLVPVLYPHSLLFFVSGVVESEVDAPIVGMQRFYDHDRFPDSEHPSIKTVRDFVEQTADRSVWSVTDDHAPAGQRSTATEHGAFDDEDPVTLDSVKHILSHGF